MNARPGELTRQQLYDRIRESSRDEVILEEMIQLGFWPKGEQQPNFPDEMIRRSGEIRRELRELNASEARWRDPDAALKELHKARKKAALERRKDTKRRNAESRYERALAWRSRRRDELLYLGEDVSGGLSAGTEAEETDVRPLADGLPAIATPKALADAIGVPLAELRFLAFDRALSRISHYQRFAIPKKTGGQRLISAPMPRLKRAQYWILDNILAQTSVHDAAHGFVADRSIVTNAAAHMGRDVVVNLDLRDFFPTLTFRRIKGKFRGLGYAEPVATTLALLCTEPDVDEVEIDGERLFAARGPRRLPQGAPTSPMLTNLVCARLDARLTGLARAMGFTYTRYADDMTFSASGPAAGKVGVLLAFIRDIVAGEGFIIHPDKTRIMRRGARQEVTGLTVNERVGVPRDLLRRFRALLHQIEASGPTGKQWGKARNVMDAAHGFASFVRMVTPDTGDALLAHVRKLEQQHRTATSATAGPTTGATTAAYSDSFRALAAAGAQPLERWWTPADMPEPTPDPILLAPTEQPDVSHSVSPSQPQPQRSVLDMAGLRARPEERRQDSRASAPPSATTDEDDAPALNPWVALVGVVVLVNFGFIINPLVGLLVLIAAIGIATGRFIRRRNRRRK